MKAGHELDVLVAEKLFNHKAYRVPDNGPPVYIAEEHEWVYPGDCYYIDKTGVEHFVPAYSTTYEGMGLVLERMERQGWEYELERRKGKPHKARFDKFDAEPFSSFVEWSADIRHAVSLAALEACKHGH